MLVLVSAQSCPTLVTLWTVVCQAPQFMGFSRQAYWSEKKKNTGVSSHSLLQGIFLTQGSNPSLLHCRWIVYHSATWETSKRL